MAIKRFSFSEMALPKISVVTPTYNASATIQTCLESVTHQSYRPVEHIIVDGASQDGTMELVRSFARRHKHVRCRSEKDEGIYDAMNQGIKMAAGEWIYILGSDDTFYQDDVLSQVFTNELLLDADVIYGDVLSERFGGKYDGEFSGEKIVKKNICHQAIFFRRSVFEKVGMFDLQFKGHADWDHNLRWLLNPAIRRTYVPITIANYADGGFSSVNPDHTFGGMKKILALRYDRGVLSPRYKASLAKALAKEAFAIGNRREAFRYYFLFLKSRIQAL